MTDEIATTYVAVPKQANSVVTIDGYKFVGFTYGNAWDQWFQLRADPNYVSKPPVTDISVEVDVSGEVV